MNEIDVVKGKNGARYLFEALLSLNAALIYRLARAETSHSTYETSLRLRINSYAHLPPYSYVGGYLAFTILALGLALSFFVLLRLSSRGLLRDGMLAWVGGIISLGALPAYYLTVGSDFGQTNPTKAVLVIELVAVISCLWLYLRQKWPLQSGWSVALLMAHHVLWGWLLLSLFSWSKPFLYVVPVSGACSSIFWVLYTSSRR